MDEKFIEEIVADVRNDYENRAAERRRFEAQWQLNANFAVGNQYCRVGINGDVEDCARDYGWQEREVYNHIASILDSRLAKLARVRPGLTVRPASNDDADVKTAAVSGKILASACEKLSLSALVSKATAWSEITGTAFYKVTWDGNGGKRVGGSDEQPVYEGEVRVDVCPPHEILPDRLDSDGLEACRSIIHAKALSADEVKRVWGVDVEPEETVVIGFDAVNIAGTTGLTGAIGRVGADKRRDRVLVLERYTRPSPDKPNGELVIVAGKKLLHHGFLPYRNGADGERDFPFVRQNSLDRVGCFYGTCAVERAVPLQRAYNAVKNRKHEFLNRIAMGVLAVEDGSVDTDLLETDGLAPGTILVYRQGSAPPRLMNVGSVPADFTIEEQRLLDEFADVSGTSEIMRSSRVPSTVTSGVAIQLLIEQDDTRISVTAENIRRAVREIAQQMLRLYRAFAAQPRLSRFVGEEGETELVYWSRSDVGSDDVVFETENEINSTAAARKSMMFDLLKAGLLHDENGKLSDPMRYKILEAFGYGGWERTQDVAALHVARAEKENAEIRDKDPKPSELDDHDLHIAEHVKYYLGSDCAEVVRRRPEVEERLVEHVRAHRRLKAAESLAKESEL